MEACCIDPEDEALRRVGVHLSSSVNVRTGPGRPGIPLVQAAFLGVFRGPLRVNGSTFGRIASDRRQAAVQGGRGRTITKIAAGKPADANAPAPKRVCHGRDDDTPISNIPEQKIRVPHIANGPRRRNRGKET